VVLITLLAARSFDPRLIWAQAEAPSLEHREPP
jgi:uncharacterized paraquat-inducible protein A